MIYFNYSWYDTFTNQSAIPVESRVAEISPLLPVDVFNKPIMNFVSMNNLSYVTNDK
jgi:hypothetical protein